MTYALTPQRREYQGEIKRFIDYLIAGGLDETTALNFIEYHLQRKQIWYAFEALALRAISHGVKHWGSKGIMEMVRFKLSIENRSTFRICNSMSAYYSRLFNWKYPQHRKFLREKRIRGLKKINREVTFKRAA